MKTQRTKIKRHVAAIRRELAAFTTAGRRSDCETWLAAEFAAMLPQTGGEGVAQGAAASKCDCLPPPNEIPQSVPREARWEVEPTQLSPGTWGPAVDVNVEPFMPVGVNPYPILKTEPQCETGPLHVGAPAVLSDLQAAYGEEAVAAGVALADAPRWPVEAEVTIFGNVPNPTMMAGKLGDGRRVSLLKGVRKDFRAGQVFRAKWSGRGTVGNPIYEVA